MKLLVCGGRDYSDRAFVFATLDAVHQKRAISTIIQGGANGADALAAEWARARRIPYWTFPANWSEYGNKAGHIRNQQMLDVAKPDGVVAFPGGRGTDGMVKLAEAAGVTVWRRDDS